MVALAVVSVLGVLSYRALSAASDSRDHLERDYQRWRDISRFVQTADIDLSQIVARPPSVNQAAISLRLSPIAADGGVEMDFIKLDGARATARRIGYRLHDGKLSLLRWPGTDSASPPSEDVVLDGVSALRFTCITANGQRVAVWPTTPPQIAPLPEAIDIELELADAGRIRRLIALR